MRKSPATLADGGRSVALVMRLTREFVRPHAKQIVVAFVLMGARATGARFSFVAALLLVYAPLKSLANLNASLQEGLAGAQRVFEVLDLETTIRDMPVPDPCASPPSGLRRGPAPTPFGLPLD